MIGVGNSPVPPPGPANFMLLAAIVFIYQVIIKRRA